MLNDPTCLFRDLILTLNSNAFRAAPDSSKQIIATFWLPHVECLIVWHL